MSHQKVPYSCSFYVTSFREALKEMNGQEKGINLKMYQNWIFLFVNCILCQSIKDEFFLVCEICGRMFVGVL